MASSANSSQQTLATPPKEADPLLKDAEPERELIRDVVKDDWIRRVHESEASDWIDLCLKDHPESTVKDLKREMFDAAYAALGDEMLPEDLTRLIVVKTERYPWYQVYFFGCITCGLFCVFRPRDNETVLVLTKKERVVMYKVERLSFFGNFADVLITFRNYGVVIFMLWATQMLATQVLSSSLIAGQFEHAKDWEQTVQKVFRETLWVQILIFTFIGFGLIFWLWTKCPHDYGTRSRHSHAANRVCIGQYSLTGGAWRRQAKLRLHFGRYPDQAQLDTQMLLSGPPAAGPIDKESLSVTKITLNPFSGGNKNKGLVLVGIVLLNLLSFTNAFLTYAYAPYQLFQQAQQSKGFCLQAPTQDQCTMKQCTAWAGDQNLPSLFCQYVEWINDTSRELDCLTLYAKRVPCCGKCEEGAYKTIVEDKMTAFSMIISLLTDLGTISFGLSAATFAFAAEKDKGYIDISWGKRPLPRYRIADFLLTQPLGMQFVASVFQSAFNEPDTKKKLSNNNNNNKGFLRRQHKYEKLTGDEGANFRDINNYNDQYDEYANWEQFFNGIGHLPKKTMVEEGEDRWVPKLNVPKKILGFVEGETVVGAWSERPEITLLLVAPVFLLAIILWLILLALLRDDTLGPYLKFLGETIWEKFLATVIIAVVALVIGLLVLYVYFFVAQKHAIILTDRRIFYVRYRDKCLTMCMYTVQVRVDIFRHDHQISYGSMMTNPPSLYMRAAQVPWTPGKIVLQPPYYGVLQLNRQRGNVLNIFQAISQMVDARSPVISEQSLGEAGVSWDVCRLTVEKNMEERLADVWGITNLQPDDTAGTVPDIFLANRDEKPLFYWSFKEFGWLSQPTSTNTDLVVTTNRIYKYNRANFKPYDCRTAMCFGACYCTAFKRLINGPKYLHRAASFLMLPSLLSFNTEVTVSPPVWYDPQRLPVKVPCWETCCTWCTLFWTCRTCGKKGETVTCNTRTCSIMPRRGGARAQLWMMWRHRFNSLQPDLMCKVRPFILKDRAFIADVCEHLGCGANELEDDSIPDEADYKKVDMLRKIMGVVQDAAGMAVSKEKDPMRLIEEHAT